ncbi:hypothetical protein HanRHA438_Chr06g0266651 [Helianthus annuus]|uniref:Uncharacterized protein n=2 Tax=Helianthus annuus TaxID=4232 RepID=A0A9K3ISK2_HELAN|nr:uncharacterized protein LOC110865324 [Helianthus annuus]KAF5802256.1 hypothetical protein HanXRQr2_Chr06g0257451 [Helianthus annuus]KAJ0560404.1 hypothetical protein HanHA300_Chr06g0211011 [Helianthus annuus]KAJ0573434.1 hypothetical protein HanHA89_Chr06g0226711 [Helianthus annuus]KAJ0737814.1 hypothetical protein HanLR1_Chr06g0211161 [Helianthus annuus]KAJ0740699.1 hypothetical protein HanOQP8_Chr06g0219701 [Helianthus annuus]
MMEQSFDYTKPENGLYVDQRHVSHFLPVMNHNEPIKDDWKTNIPPRFNNNNSTLVENRSVMFSRNKKKIQQTPTNPSRSSPLRRFLDPLLNPKGAHLAQKVHQPKLEPTSLAFAPNELLHSKKHRSCNVQALLQLRLKSGIPFFKLVVEGSSDILAAAVKKIPSGNNDTSLIYAFYSVHDAKKKSGGWMYKEKSYCFEYNMVGQMKICSSYHAEFNGSEKGLCVVRESVLYSSGTTRADQGTVLEGELAAIIVKNPSDESCGGIGGSRTTTVVLPDSVHSWPNGGSPSPSPLIKRWRFGGLCDCGGWDIGCQFHVLGSHQNEMVKPPSTSNRLDLCYQVGHKNKRGFRLVSVEDGLYSLEYDPSMSLLQAFSICVAVVSSQKLSHIFEVSYVPESKDLSRPMATDNERVNGRVSESHASPVAWV